MKILIGNSGLVGSTLKNTIKFDYEFNSKNLLDLLKVNDTNQSSLYLACLPATKWVVNKNPKKDFDNIKNIVDVICQKEFKKVILISTIDVYHGSALKSNEDSVPIVKDLNYGSNRYIFEILISQTVKSADIKTFRLPAVFNSKIKKNILYDLIHNNNVSLINKNSCFQWYNLDALSFDIESLSAKFSSELVFNLFSEPLNTEVIVNLFPKLSSQVPFLENKIEYDFQTKYNPTGYIKNQQAVLSEIKSFINEFSRK